MEILIMIVVYGISAFMVYKYMQIAHSKGGIWSSSETGGGELFITFCPILNTLFMISWLVNWPFRNKRYSPFSNCNKFFKIK